MSKIFSKQTKDWVKYEILYFLQINYDNEYKKSIWVHTVLYIALAEAETAGRKINLVTKI